MAVALATLFGLGGVYCAEIVYDVMRDAGASEIPQLPGWRAHMASACVGSVAFVTCLFLLESLGKRSRGVALRSAGLWFPLVALTGLATAVHIPVYLVILLAALYSPWAYLRTREVR